MGSSTAGGGGPDLRAGVALAALGGEGMLAGQVDGEPVLLVRQGEEVLAVDGTCPHYGAPLQAGLVVGETIRCAWHHACFSLRTGAALRAPALRPLGRWAVRIEGGQVRVTGRVASAARRPRVQAGGAGRARILVVGAGAAGSSAVRTLRAEGYDGELLLIDPDPDAPYDRPNLSKDYLAGTAPESWLPLWPADFCARERVQRVVARVAALDPVGRSVRLEDGTVLSGDGLLIATGAVPITPPIPGAELPHVRVLRSLADCRGLLSLIGDAAAVVIAGASFIGLEAAAALRTRGLNVTVVAPEPVPFARTLGTEVGAALRALHERHGVRFRLGRKLARIGAGHVELDDGSSEAGDVVLLGVGVRPAPALAAELTAGNGAAGIEVSAQLETRFAGVYAAGDVALYPDAVSGERVRIEHWVVAQRQGATAARNLLGRAEPFCDVPFFWTQQYDFTLAYVGHGAGWDRLVLDGDLSARDARITYLRGGRSVAVATVGRDRENLRAELALEAASARSCFTPGGESAP